MKKILFILGSRNSTSKELALAKLVSEKLDSSPYSVEIITPNDWKLNPVMDGKIFITGIDEADSIQDDDGTKLKNKLLDSDLIILATPVYAHAVSSDIKLLIERISGWLHIFRLLGKPGISVVAASNNGFTEVQDYLEFIMASLGIEVVESVTLLDNKINFVDEANLVRAAIESSLNPRRRPKVSRTTEQQFTYYKKLYKNMSRALAEPKYWEEKGWFEYSTLQAYLDLNHDTTS